MVVEETRPIVRCWFGSAILLLSLIGCSHPAGRTWTPSYTPAGQVIASTRVPPGDRVTPGISPLPSSSEPTIPIPGGDDGGRGPVYLESAQLLVKGNHQTQVTLVLRGHVPTPCHTLRVEVVPPDRENQIRVSVYSLFDEEKVCAQVLSPFDVQIPFEEYPAGRYTVVVNGEVIGEFTW